MRQSAIRALDNYGKTILSRDFFGIRDITSKDIAAAFANRVILSPTKIKSKYDALLVDRNRLANEENEENATYGHIRKDNQNEPKFHGQYDKERTEKLYNSVDVKQRFVQDKDDEHGIETEGSYSTSKTAYEDTPDNNSGNPAYRISDVQPEESLSKILSQFNSGAKESEIATKYANSPPLTFLYDQAVSSSIERNWSKMEQPGTSSGRSVKADQVQSGEIRLDMLVDSDEEPVATKEKLGIMPTQNSKFNRYLDRKYDVDQSKKSKRIQAMDHVVAQRAKISKLEHPLIPHLRLDSKGKRNYAHQVPNWYNARKVDILDFLKQSIIYHNHDILAINKPYGLASHGEEKERESYDLNSLMNELAKSMFRIDQLHLVHRLDKTTTGVLLFATSQARASSLHKQFRSDEIKKTYLALTRGIPSPEEGIIDIPIGEMSFADKVVMCPVPEKLSPEMQLAKHYAEARRAVTQYKTLLVGKGNISLVEIRPRSGVKHQIRCHLGFGLKTPILGDHKYTELGKLAPQKLPAHALQALQLRQTKVRTLPIHLHAKSIVIPNAKANSESLFIDAPLPHHFKENMKSLELSHKE